MRKMLFMWIIIAAPALAFTIDTPLPDAAQEARAQALFRQFRCVVCQSESVADSPADIAQDVRRTIRQQMAQGKSDAEITELLVASYGEFVLMQPRLAPHNYLLWGLPLILLLAGGWVVRKQFRKNAS